MPSKGDKLRAFCSITIDDAFVIRDLKIIEGTKGPFVAMPSRKLMDRCSRCNGKNHHRARFCNECGLRLPVTRKGGDPATRFKLHSDIAHPINAQCREVVQRRILEEYLGELERSRAPDYRPAELEVFDEEGFRDDLCEAAAEAADTPSLRFTAQPRSLPAEPKPQARRPELEPEDNFGVGLFS